MSKAVATIKCNEKGAESIKWLSTFMPSIGIALYTTDHAEELYKALMHQRECHKCADLIEGQCEGWKQVNKAIANYEESRK